MFPQVAGGKWDAKTQTGEARFAGAVTFNGHGGAMALALTDPIIKVSDRNSAVLTAVIDGKRLNVVDIDLSGTKPTTANGATTWTNAPTTLRAEAVESFNDFYKAGSAAASVTFTVGAASTAKPTPTTPPTKPTTKPEAAVKPAPTKAANGAKSAGSLSWGISSGFANYTTGRIAKGSIATNGVGASGGAYLFPQANDTWNAESQTGTVQYSGVVTFTGHKNAMVETFANPTITVSSASSATMNVGGRSFALDLSAANKSVGANGEVSWSGVPVGGSISGSGAGGGGAFPPDSLSFSVGTASGVSYGSTAVSNDDKKRTVAETAPTTTGIRVLTAPEDITPGAELEFEATGFEADERDVIVAMYPGIVVLDEAAGANAVGAIRWIGTLPEDIEAGEYIITAQGSIDVGAVFTVVDEKKAKAAKKANNTKTQLAQGVNEDAVTAAGIAPEASGPVWLWWTVAGALLVIAATMGGLVIARRRAAV